MSRDIKGTATNGLSLSLSLSLSEAHVESEVLYVTEFGEPKIMKKGLALGVLSNLSTCTTGTWRYHFTFDKNTFPT